VLRIHEDLGKNPPNIFSAVGHSFFNFSHLFPTPCFRISRSITLLDVIILISFISSSHVFRGETSLCATIATTWPFRIAAPVGK
jgi:hypothetical protein